MYNLKKLKKIAADRKGKTPVLLVEWKNGAFHNYFSTVDPAPEPVAPVALEARAKPKRARKPKAAAEPTLKVEKAAEKPKPIPPVKGPKPKKR